ACASPSSVLQDLVRQTQATLTIATRHAAGELDADALASACERLARAFVQARPVLAHLTASPGNRAALRELQGQLQTLHELQARLSAQARAALATLLPQDALQEYARLGQQTHAVRRLYGG
ncbi:MAG: hypothetical protein NZ694_11150, partial [Tepidimonas sp.]|nr:hypothetical protein [Tepidimonas sp.]